MARYDPALDRQMLHRLAAEFSAIVRSFCDHGTVVKGSLQALRRRCGKPACRCARGPLHQSTVFVDRSSGAVKIRKVNQRQYKKLIKPTATYRSLRHARARLSKIKSEALQCCDRLSAHRFRAGERFQAKLFD